MILGDIFFIWCVKSSEAHKVGDYQFIFYSGHHILPTGEISFTNYKYIRKTLMIELLMYQTIIRSPKLFEEHVKGARSKSDSVKSFILFWCW